VRVILIVILKPLRQLLHCGPGVIKGVHLDVIPLKCLYKRLRHTVGLRAVIGGRADPEAHKPAEVAGLIGRICRAVVAQPLYEAGQLIDKSKALSIESAMRSRTISPQIPPVVATCKIRSKLDTQSDCN